MSHAIDVSPGFVLHSRPYRDHRVLLDCFTKQFGLLTLMARSRTRGKNANKPLLQPFIPLLLSWSGRSELKNLAAIEATGTAFSLTTNRWAMAFYVNELLLRLLGRHDPYPPLFDAYQQVLQALTTPSLQAEHVQAEQALRVFELLLLDALGYGLSLTVDTEGDAVDAEQNYLYQPEQGFIPHARLLQRAPFQQDPSHQSFHNVPRSSLLNKNNKPTHPPLLLPGAHLLQIAALTSSSTVDSAVLTSARRLLRQTLAVHLGHKPLKSRALWRPDATVQPRSSINTLARQ